MNHRATGQGPVYKVLRMAVNPKITSYCIPRNEIFSRVGRIRAPIRTGAEDRYEHKMFLVYLQDDLFQPLP